MARLGPSGSVQFAFEFSGASAVLGKAGGTASRGQWLRRIRQLFLDHQLSVTWCVASHDDEGLEFAREDSVLGDVALLINEQLLPATTTRHGFQEVLCAALARCYGSQGPVMHVMADLTALEQYPDILRSHGIRGILGAAVSGRVSRGNAQPRQLRHGLTGIPCAACFPDSSGWWGRWDGGFRAKSVLVRAWQQRTSEQIVIRESAMAAGGAATWRSLQRLLLAAERTIAHQRLRCETATEVCERLGARPAASAQRSILRAA